MSDHDESPKPINPNRHRFPRIAFRLDEQGHIMLRRYQRDGESIDLTAKRLLLDHLRQLNQPTEHD